MEIRTKDKQIAWTLAEMIKAQARAQGVQERPVSLDPSRKVVYLSQTVPRELIDRVTAGFNRIKVVY